MLTLEITLCSKVPMDCFASFCFQKTILFKEKNSRLLRVSFIPYIYSHFLQRNEFLKRNEFIKDRNIRNNPVFILYISKKHN